MDDREREDNLSIDNQVSPDGIGTCGECRESTAEPGETAGGPAEGAAGEAADGDEREGLAKALAGEKAKAEDYFSRLVRLQADFDNYRKRVAREREDLLKYAGEQLITALLPVVDNFERALAAKSNDYEKLLEGVEMICRQLQEVLSREGLEPIPAAGEQFNPELHEAVMREEGGDCPDNTVTEELRRGFTFKGKVIRAAMVKVKG